MGVCQHRHALREFIQPAAAVTLDHKFADAAEVNRLTGASPTMALHVLWDLPHGKADVPMIREMEKKHGIKAGSINPNLFQDQEYKFGSLCNPSKEIRQHALKHLIDSVVIGHELNDRDISIWMADGSNYPARKASANAPAGCRMLLPKRTNIWAQSSEC